MATKVLIINGHTHEVHHDALTGAQIKALGHHDHAHLFRIDGEMHVIVQDDELVHLEVQERFITTTDITQFGQHLRHQAITIEVDGDPYPTREHVLTGLQIKELAHKPAGNRLFRLLGDGQRIEITDAEKVHLHEGEQFVTLPPIGRAS